MWTDVEVLWFSAIAASHARQHKKAEKIVFIGGEQHKMLGHNCDIYRYITRINCLREAIKSIKYIEMKKSIEWMLICLKKLIFSPYYVFDLKPRSRIHPEHTVALAKKFCLFPTCFSADAFYTHMSFDRITIQKYLFGVQFIFKMFSITCKGLKLISSFASNFRKHVITKILTNEKIRSGL